MPEKTKITSKALEDFLVEAGGRDFADYGAVGHYGRRGTSDEDNENSVPRYNDLTAAEDMKRLRDSGDLKILLSVLGDRAKLYLSLYNHVITGGVADDWVDDHPEDADKLYGSAFDGEEWTRDLIEEHPDLGWEARNPIVDNPEEAYTLWWWDTENNAIFMPEDEDVHGDLEGPRIHVDLMGDTSIPHGRFDHPRKKVSVMWHGQANETFARRAIHALKKDWSEYEIVLHPPETSMLRFREGMKALEVVISEKWFDTVRVRGKNVDIFVNPSLSEIDKEDLGQVVNTGADEALMARAFLLPNGSALVFSAWNGLHSEVSRQVPAASDNALPVMLLFDQDGLGVVVVTDSSKGTKYFHNPATAEFIRQHAWVKRVASGEITVEYFDQGVVGDWAELERTAVSESLLLEAAKDRYRQMLAFLDDKEVSKVRKQLGLSLSKKPEEYVKEAMRAMTRQDRVVWLLSYMKVHLASSIAEVARQMVREGDEGAQAVADRMEKIVAKAASAANEGYIPALLTNAADAMSDVDSFYHYFGEMAEHIQEIRDFSIEPWASVHATLNSLRAIERAWSNNDQHVQDSEADEPIIEFPDGFAWVNLHKGYCSAEGKAMGHCGNVNGRTRPAETILSLRKKLGRGKSRPSLTFILNKETGALGEMKGRGNNKPDEKYHPYIIALLKSDYVKRVAGGGYLPENNFSLDDLDDETREELLEEKPSLAGFWYRYVRDGDFDADEVMEAMSEKSVPVVRLATNGHDFVLGEFDTFADLAGSIEFFDSNDGSLDSFAGAYGLEGKELLDYCNSWLSWGEVSGDEAKELLTSILKGDEETELKIIELFKYSDPAFYKTMLKSSSVDQLVDTLLSGDLREDVTDVLNQAYRTILGSYGAGDLHNEITQGEWYYRDGLDLDDSQPISVQHNQDEYEVRCAPELVLKVADGVVDPGNWSDLYSIYFSDDNVVDNVREHIFSKYSEEEPWNVLDDGVKPIVSKLLIQAVIDAGFTGKDPYGPENEHPGQQKFPWAMECFIESLLGEGRSRPFQQSKKDFLGPYDPNWEWGGNEYKDHKRKGGRWERSVTHAIIHRKLDPGEARDLGYYPMGDSKFLPLPEDLYHVTTAKDAVVNSGKIKTRAELSMDLGTGLGGGPDDTISFTGSLETAQVVKDSILEMRRFLAGEVSSEELIRAAKRGDMAKKPYYKTWVELVGGLDNLKPQVVDEVFEKLVSGDWTLDGGGLASTQDEHPDWIPVGDPIKVPAGDIYYLWLRPREEDEKDYYRYSYFQSFIAARDMAGGPENPVFFSVNSSALKKIDPSQIAILHFKRAYDGVLGARLNALDEWRVHFRDQVRFVAVVDGGGEALESVLTESRAAKFVFAWHCPSAPQLDAWSEVSGEDLESCVDIIDYIRDHGEEVDFDEFVDAVGGLEVIARDYFGRGPEHEESLEAWGEFIRNDWSMGFYKSQYPDGTPIYYHSNSGIEHVYQPAGYSIPDDGLGLSESIDPSDMASSVYVVKKGTKLYHGTGETFDFNRPSSGGDGVLWTTDSPKIARTYIPSAGLTGILSFRDYAKDEMYWPSSGSGWPDKLRISLIKAVAGVEPNITLDSKGQVQSVGMPGGRARLPSESEVEEYIQSLGYTKDPQYGFYEVALGDGGTTVLPNGPGEGNLVVIVPNQDLKLFDYAALVGDEGDLQEPQYQHYSVFKAAANAGYDGIRITDFLQSKKWGNYGHISLGLFDASRSKWDVESADSTTRLDDPTLDENLEGDSVRVLDPRMLGHHHGQSDMVVYAVEKSPRGDIIQGKLEYSLFDGKVHINMIEVADDRRRRGIATAMVKKMLSAEGVKWADVEKGYSTDDGSKFVDHTNKVLESVLYEGTADAVDLVPIQTADDLRRAAQKWYAHNRSFSPYVSIRGLVMPDGSLVVWRATEALHYEVEGRLRRAGELPQDFVTTTLDFIVSPLTNWTAAQAFGTRIGKVDDGEEKLLPPSSVYDGPAFEGGWDFDRNLGEGLYGSYVDSISRVKDKHQFAKLARVWARDPEFAASWDSYPGGLSRTGTRLYNKFFVVRGLMHLPSGELHVWPASAGVHSDGMRTLEKLGVMSNRAEWDLLYFETGPEIGYLPAGAGDTGVTNGYYPLRGMPSKFTIDKFVPFDQEDDDEAVESALDEALDGPGQRAVDEMGTTDNPGASGAIMSDGTLLDMSYGSGSRADDHRILGHYLDPEDQVPPEEYASSSKNMMTFFRNGGHIRWMPEGPGFDIYAEPTREQDAAMLDIMRGLKEIFVDCEDGNRKWSIEVDLSERNPKWVLAKIDQFYDGVDLDKYGREIQEPEEEVDPDEFWADEVKWVVEEGDLRSAQAEDSEVVEVGDLRFVPIDSVKIRGSVKPERLASYVEDFREEETVFFEALFVHEGLILGQDAKYRFMAVKTMGAKAVPVQSVTYQEELDESLKDLQPSVTEHGVTLEKARHGLFKVTPHPTQPDDPLEAALVDAATLSDDALLEALG